MCKFSAPPGYVRTKPIERPTLGPFIPVIEAILAAADASGCTIHLPYDVVVARGALCPDPDATASAGTRARTSAGASAATVPEPRQHI